MDVKDIREPVKQKPRTVPIVALWMIARALGQKINSRSDQEDNARGFKEHEGQELNIQDKDKVDSNLRTETYQDSVFVSGQNCVSVDACRNANSNGNKRDAFVVNQRNVSDEPSQPTGAS
ncbi:hypothetical protein DITRI_Ditri06bG0100800 [Diplodiscus trichospermus]